MLSRLDESMQQQQHQQQTGGHQSAICMYEDIQSCHSVKPAQARGSPVNHDIQSCHSIKAPQARGSPVNHKDEFGIRLARSQDSFDAELYLACAYTVASQFGRRASAIYMRTYNHVMKTYNHAMKTYNHVMRTYNHVTQSSTHRGLLSIYNCI